MLLLSQLFACISMCVVLAVNGEVYAPLMLPTDSKLVIPNKYIVVFKDEPSAVSSQSTSQSNHAIWLQSRISSTTDSKLEHSFNVEGMSGYSGYFSPDLVDEIRQRQEVKYVEADQLMYAMYLDAGMKQKSKKGFKSIMKSYFGPIHEVKASSAAAKMTQMHAPWGLERLSYSNSAGGPGSPEGYQYPSSAGQGVDVYIIDTGINVAHEEFEGRARWGKTIPLFDLDIDGNGHGTHCAGTIGSRMYGVAKKANLIAVKVLRTSGFGTNSDVIKGVEWVTKQHKRGRGSRQSVANMSLGGGRSTTLERVVDKAVEAGVHFSVAAGNDAEDACEYSPAAAAGPITVGATTSTDSITYFSNFGKCVDIFAPGLDIKSTWIGAPDAVNTISGTSMASPHVAGVLALYLGEEAGEGSGNGADGLHKSKSKKTKSRWTPAALKEELKRIARKNAMGSLPTADTPNLLVSTKNLLENLKEKGQLLK